MSCTRYLDWHPRLRKHPVRLWPQEWQDHLAACPECRYQHELAQKLHEVYRAEGEPDIPPRFAEHLMAKLVPRQSRYRVWNFRLQGVAAVMAVIFIGLSLKPVIATWGVKAVNWFWSALSFLLNSWGLLKMPLPSTGAASLTTIFTVIIGGGIILLTFAGTAIYWLWRIERSSEQDSP